MKLTSKQLKRMIREELQSMQEFSLKTGGAFDQGLKQAAVMWKKGTDDVNDPRFAKLKKEMENLANIVNNGQFSVEVGGTRVAMKSMAHKGGGRFRIWLASGDTVDAPLGYADRNGAGLEMMLSIYERGVGPDPEGGW
jgi:hypothetical protein